MYLKAAIAEGTHEIAAEDARKRGDPVPPFDYETIGGLLTRDNLRAALAWKDTTTYPYAPESLPDAEVVLDNFVWPSTWENRAANTGPGPSPWQKIEEAAERAKHLKTMQAAAKAADVKRRSEQVVVRRSSRLVEKAAAAASVALLANDGLDGSKRTAGRKPKRTGRTKRRKT